MQMGKLSKLEPILVGDRLLLEDFQNTTISHLGAFSSERFQEVNFVTVKSWASRNDMLLASMHMSAACRCPPALIGVVNWKSPNERDWSCLRSVSITD